MYLVVLRSGFTRPASRVPVLGDPGTRVALEPECPRSPACACAPPRPGRWLGEHWDSRSEDDGTRMKSGTAGGLLP